MPNSTNSQDRPKAIFVVAPYSPVGRSAHPNLGAASKIRAVIRILAKTGMQVVLINSAHNELHWRRTTINQAPELGQNVIEVIPFTIPLRKYGKALNAFNVRVILSHLTRLWNPSMVWIYNGYVFECRAALLLKKMHPSMPIVLEIEDWPDARGRSSLGRIKEYLDIHYQHAVTKIASLVTCINESVSSKPELRDKNCIIFPGVIRDAFGNSRFSPRPINKGRLMIGYFGGMTAEKGFDIFLEAARISAERKEPRFHFIACGAGPLQDAAMAHAGMYPRTFECHIGVDDDTLDDLMYRCHVIVNPHSKLPGNGEAGIFPFKVIEAIAAGTLLVSTPLPACGYDLSDAIIPFDGTPEGLLDAFEYVNDERYGGAKRVRTSIIDLLSEEAMYKKLIAAIPLNLR